MAQIIAPEIVLLTAFKTTLKLIKSDWDSNVDKTQTILYRSLYNVKLQKYDLYTQATKIFTADDTDPRRVDVNLFFNMARAAFPTLHITVPSESQAPQGNGLGIDEGLIDPEFLDVDESTSSLIGAFRRVFQRRYKATYSLVITSDNSNEVIVMYHFLRGLLIALTNHLNMVGLQNIKMSGRDLPVDSSQVPPNIYMRALGLEFEYDVEQADVFNQEMLVQLLYQGIIINPD